MFPKIAGLLIHYVIITTTYTQVNNRKQVGETPIDSVFRTVAAIKMKVNSQA